MKISIRSLEELWSSLEIPDSCKLNKPVFKKLFLDNGTLDAADRKTLGEDVIKVRWLYTLKPSTINIAPYVDQVREYPELAVLQVELSNANRLNRIANFINRSIPYPLVLIFTLEADHATSVAISLADKRINQADNEKWVLEDSVQSGWISLEGQDQAQAEFLASLKVTELPFKDFWSFYQALIARVIASNCAVHSGSFKLDSNRELDGNSRLERLRELEKLDAQRIEITNKLKKEKQMGKQVELNIKVKKISDRIDEIKASL